MRYFALIILFLATPAAALDFQDYVRCATFEMSVDLHRIEGQEVSRGDESVQTFAALGYELALADDAVMQRHRLAYNSNDVIIDRMLRGDISPQLANGLFACKAREY